MFSHRYTQFDGEVRSTLSRAHCPSAGRTRELCARAAEGPLPLAELSELLEIGANENATEQSALLRSSLEARFRGRRPNRLRYIAPVYISSFCVDTCGYCNFSASRSRTVRRRLSLEELTAEVRTLRAAGAQVIELVLGTDPELTWQELTRYVAHTAELLEGAPGSGVMLCSDHFPAEAYVALREAGMVGMVQWDETLEEAAYRRWHSASPRKRHFENRMDTHDHALAAGMDVAAGALFGLADFRYEALMQIVKARYLAAEYGRAPFTFGTARIKPIEGQELNLKTGVSDWAYQTALMVYKMAEPGIGRWLQTRETLDLNLRNMLDGDVFTHRCGEVTPGGHGHPPERTIGSQFRVHDLDGDTVDLRLRELGFEIDYAWLPACRPAPARA